MELRNLDRSSRSPSSLVLCAAERRSLSQSALSTPSGWRGNLTAIGKTITYFHSYKWTYEEASSSMNTQQIGGSKVRHKKKEAKTR
jgi:hypothetical protein